MYNDELISILKKRDQIRNKYGDCQESDELEKIMVNNNTFPFKAKLGMVLTSWSGQLIYMKHVLKQYRKIKDMFIIGAFDNRLVTKNEKTIPFPDIWNLAHMWVNKHYTYGGHAKRHGWIWSQIYASSILRTFKNIEYIFSANGDCVWDRPEGVYEIIDVLGDNDFMSGQSETRKTDGFHFIHTCSMVFKREAYFSFIDYVIDQVMHETKTVSFSPEGLVRKWAEGNNIKWEHAPIQPYYKTGPDVGRHDTYCESSSESTWKNILGFRNLEAEKNWRCSHGEPPLDKKYFDLRVLSNFKDNDKNYLVPYYKTGDEKYLKLWWYMDPNLPRKERLKRMAKLKSGGGIC